MRLISNLEKLPSGRYLKSGFVETTPVLAFFADGRNQVQTVTFRIIIVEKFSLKKLTSKKVLV